jgi:pyruvate formate lyase activating enzyme
MKKLSDVLDGLTSEGELVTPLPDGALRCTACGHRCLIRPGRRGICQVRFNQDGKLRVPWGYVAALQADPVEKKPFNHILPGAVALTFGMLGCDFHCGYCFAGDTIVITNHGPESLERIFATTPRRDQARAEIAYPEGLQAVTRDGAYHRIRAVFRHAYQGKLVVLKPDVLPELHCTPDHRLYATDDPARPPALIQAQRLTLKHYLAVPRRYDFGNLRTIDMVKELEAHQGTHRIAWRLKRAEPETILEATSEGKDSRQVGRMLVMDPSSVRQIRSNYARGLVKDELAIGYRLEQGVGIPVALGLDVRMAALLGLYCAKGSVTVVKHRPNSRALRFSFALDQQALAERTGFLLQDLFRVNASLVHAQTELVLQTGETSMALLFETLAGRGAANKRIPRCIFEAPREVIATFLEAYVSGAGHRDANGKVSCTTVSSGLAWGVGWLALKNGQLPSVYETRGAKPGFILGRTVQRCPIQYTIVWYEKDSPERKALETQDYYLVPLKEISSAEHDGFVYNLEVEENHNYLAGFFLVSNCQNWLTSQAVRDPAAEESVSLVHRVSPEQVVEIARRYAAEVIASSYNEPLITSEWAVAIFKQAKVAGMKCVYVSNGNSTPEVLEYLRPYLDGMKVDLKSMQDKNYRALGGVLQHTLDTIQRAHDMGLWVEVVTLVVPGFNDSTQELWEAARFLTSVSVDIPWHVTAFHPDYKMTDPDPTPARTLVRAAEIGREAGLHFVYAGNLPGRVEEYENTYCTNCNELLIERSGYYINKYLLTEEGTCPKCHTPLAGVWRR